MNARAQVRFLALGVTFTIGLACADSQPLDPDPVNGAGGRIAITEGGSTGSGGTTGTGGIMATGGIPGTGITSTGGKGSGAGGAGAAGHAGTAGAAGHGGAAGGGGRQGVMATGGHAGSAGGATGAGGATTTATFTQIYTTILSKNCAGSACHNPGSQQGFSASSQTSAYNTLQPFIIPGDGADSVFWEAVDAGDMPRGKPKLSAASIALIKTWIDDGALDN
ncbi:MAG TPA: hypothetical protein VMT03_13515 [Polyangia bacterium]|nr:hypothetical protein [Polyangia bacterium]